MGPGNGEGNAVRIGVAAHITAAAVNGPRFDSRMSPEARAHQDNGVWLCQSCSRQVDSDAAGHSVDTLSAWKKASEAFARDAYSTPERPENRTEPILEMPSPSPHDSWLLYSSRSVPLVGRAATLSELEGFLCSPTQFCWQLICGPAGSGKSRIALELCLQKRQSWRVGFLGREQPLLDWDRFRPSRPTLIVVDYVRSRVSEVSAMVLQLARSSGHLPHPVRILLLERDEIAWLAKFNRLDSSTESAELAKACHGDPLHLAALSQAELLQLAKEVARSRSEGWRPEFLTRLGRRLTPDAALGVPLFVILLVDQLLTDAPVESIMDTGLLRMVLQKEQGRRRATFSSDSALRRAENLLVLATAVAGLLPRSGGFEYLTHSAFRQYLPRLDEIDAATHNILAGSPSSGNTLTSLQPDVLGELYVLDRLEEAFDDPEAVRVLVNFAWELSSERFCDFIVRAAMDFPDEGALLKLCELPGASTAHPRWARLVGEIISATGRDAGGVIDMVLAAMRRDVMPAAVGELAEAVASAELALANVMLARRRNPDLVLEQFGRVLAIAQPDSAVAIAGRNNRAIVYSEMRDQERALTEWSAIADGTSAGVKDEIRACALNNRADILADRGMHREAVEDRDRVLQLGDTTYNRRFIALFRRARSYVALGLQREARDDLSAILSTPDISDAQKASARIERASLLITAGDLSNATRDFEIALTSDDLFRGAEAAALVGLADVASLEGDDQRSEEYLDLASHQQDIEPQTRIRSMVVRAQLSRNRGDPKTADELCRDLLERDGVTPYLRVRIADQLA